MWLWLVACGPADDDFGLDEPLVGARLEHLDLHGMVVIGGTWGGEGSLVLEHASGEEQRDVSLRGGALGLGIELVPWASGAGTVELRLPDGPVTGDDLLGRYAGHTAAMAFVVGVASHHLENDAGVRIDAPTVDTLAAVFVGAEWVKLSLAGVDASVGP